MIDLNKVFLVGNLTRDPETRTTGNGKTVASMRLAVNRRGYGGREDEVMFIDVTVWERQAEFADKYLTKGTAIFVEGRLKEDTWEDKDSGAKRSKIAVVAERIQFAQSRSEAEATGDGGGRRETAKAGVDANGEPDDLPF